MGRWEPESQRRLEEAALELFSEQGFEHTTVAEITAAAGLTERTFYRYFRDKREVLFGGGARLKEAMTTGASGAPASAAPIDVVATALEAAGDMLQERWEFARKRQAVIAGSSELRERELVKLASMSAALAETLRQRGAREPAATLCAEAGIAVFRVAVERWAGGVKKRDLKELIAESLAELRAATSASGRSEPRVAASAPPTPRARATARR